LTGAEEAIRCILMKLAIRAGRMHSDLTMSKRLLVGHSEPIPAFQTLAPQVHPLQLSSMTHHH
jgi:hypothetical protein